MVRFIVCTLSLHYGEVEVRKKTVTHPLIIKIKIIVLQDLQWFQMVTTE